MDDARFHDLLGRYHDGETSPAEVAELESMLRADPRCRRMLVERDLMEVQLRKSYAGAMVTAHRSVRRRKSLVARGPAWNGAAIAAAALFAALLLFASMSSSPQVRRAEPAPQAPQPEQASAPPPVESSPPPAPPRKEPDRPLVPQRPVERVVPPAPIEETPKPPPAPPPVVPPPPEPPRVETRIAVATVESIEGDPGTRLTSGQVILSGQGLAIRSGVLKVKFPDGTQLVLEGATEIASIVGKRLAVQRGMVQAQVAKQPAGQPLIFATPHGEAKVLGTTLKIVVDESSTRLEVREGRVQLKRLSDGKTVDVITGHFAVIAPGADFAARPMPITDIQLTAALGQITGDDWRPVKDAEAAGGLLLEATSSPNFAAVTLPIDTAKVNAWFAKQRSRSWVTFMFTADADTDYSVWIRGRCTAPAGPGRLRADDVMLEVGDAAFVRRPADWKPYADYLSTFIGFGAQQGFWWSGGGHDPGNTQTPIGLRFKRSGRQVIRLHALETPLQIDAIWLSTTKTTRPGPEEVPGKR